MKIVCSAKSDVGLKRTRNEDRFCTDPRLGLYVVCDGMGGRNAGEIASGLAVEVIQKHITKADEDKTLPVLGRYDATFLPQTNRLASAVRLANQVIHGEAWSRPECVGMGTTVVSALITDQVLSLAHVGDSRLYLIRQEVIQALTVDHSLVMEQVRQGLLTEDEAERSPHRHVMTRALGVEATVEVELGEIPVMSGDILLLCSDGLTRGVKPAKILRTIRRENDPPAIVDRLIEMANEAGGQDNTTVVLITIHEGARQRVWRRMRTRLLSCLCE